MFSFLGKLPASTSAALTINGLDVKKILRLAVVVFIGAFATNVTGAGLTETNLMTVLTDASNAGIMAIGSATVELARRLLTNQGI